MSGSIRVVNGPAVSYGLGPLIIELAITRDGSKAAVPRYGSPRGGSLSAAIYDPAGSLCRQLSRKTIPNQQNNIRTKYIVDGDATEGLSPGEYKIVWQLDEGPGALTAETALVVRDPFPSNAAGPSIYEFPPGDPIATAGHEYRNCRAEAAESLLRRVLRERPDDAEAWHWICKVFDQRGEPDASRDAAEVAASLTTDVAAPHGLNEWQHAADLSSITEPSRGRTRAPLRLAFVAPSMEPAIGGAELTAWFLLQTALACGHEVMIITNRTPESLLRWRRGVRIEYVDRPDAIEQRLDMEAPELVITQGDWALFVDEWCGRARIPFVLRVQSYELLCLRPTLIDLCRVDSDACQCSEREMQARRRVLSRARLIVACSEFVAEEVRRWGGQETEVSYELVDSQRCRPHDGLRLGTIVMNQADYHKGFLVFRSLAKMLPAERFVCIGYGGLSIRNLTNLFRLGSVPPRILYSIADIVLLPSLWPEPFGRTALEAFIAGIPVIASRRGGLPEFTEGSALLIDNPAEPQDWRDAVVRVRVDDQLRQQMVANGRECAARFPPLPEALRLIRRLEELV
jgi:glycosyltransferase involved in cell wall biosynthesis